MELNEEDGYWRVTIDLVDGNLHFIRLLFLLFLIFVQVFIIINIKLSQNLGLKKNQNQLYQIMQRMKAKVKKDSFSLLLIGNVSFCSHG
jgi:hypothetical protein